MEEIKQEQHYDASDIQVLEGLEAVRKRPGMYIGSTDKRGLHHLVWEIVDNSIDEVMNGYGDTITITLHKDKSISVSDNGRGVPVGKHESGKSTVEVIYTVLHAGGKFEEGNYKVSGGLHGVGASVVNALSTMMIVNSRRDGKEYTISFKDGGKVASPLKEVGKTNKTGTTVPITARSISPPTIPCVLRRETNQTPYSSEVRGIFVVIRNVATISSSLKTPPVIFVFPTSNVKIIGLFLLV